MDTQAENTETKPRYSVNAARRRWGARFRTSARRPAAASMLLAFLVASMFVGPTFAGKFDLDGNPDQDWMSDIDDIQDAADNPDEPLPDWLQAVYDDITANHYVPAQFQPEVLIDQDICLSPINAWIDTDSDQLVHEAISDPLVRSELLDSLQEAFQIVADSIAESDDRLHIGQATADSIRCPAPSTYTLFDCLEEHGNLFDCKGLPSTPTAMISDLEGTLPVSLVATVNLEGDVFFSGRLNYRELTTESGGVRHEQCFHIVSHAVEGFGLFHGMAEDRVDQEVDANRDTCLNL